MRPPLGPLLLSMLVSANPAVSPAGGAGVVEFAGLATTSASAAASAEFAPETDPVFSLRALKGKVVYLDFWASWCAPCRESFPWMSRMQSELGRDGLVVVAVDVDREHADAERFIRELSPQFRVVFDPEGVLPQRFGVRGMPTSFLIDRNGRVVRRHEGFRRADRDALTRQLRALVLAR